MATVTENERRYVRVRCQSAARFEYEGRDFEAIVRDISLCGLYLMTDLQVEVGKKIRLSTTLPASDDQEIQLRGRIVRIVGTPTGPRSASRNSEEVGFGVDFAAIPLKTRTVIDNYVRETFRAFRRAQFELSKADCDEALVREILEGTYLVDKGYPLETLKDIVAAELKTFRLRPV